MNNAAKEQQIAELEKDLLKAYGMTGCHTSDIAEWLYHAGYRKEHSQVQQQTKQKPHLYRQGERK